MAAAGDRRRTAAAGLIVRRAARCGRRRSSTSLAPQYVIAVVLLSPPGDLYGLTDRELEILGLLVQGWPNRRIAAALFIAQRTVAAHLEHILPKLGAPTRTLAAVRALRLGLYVPFSLAVL
jgi:DNA-binding NarL/FixJ family response regulator